MSRQDLTNIPVKTEDIIIMVNTIPAQITQVMASMGIRGVVRVRCRLLAGRDKDKSITRSVLGPVRPGDIILLKEAELELTGGGR